MFLEPLRWIWTSSVLEVQGQKDGGTRRTMTTTMIVQLSPLIRLLPEFWFLSCLTGSNRKTYQGTQGWNKPKGSLGPRAGGTCIDFFVVFSFLKFGTNKVTWMSNCACTCGIYLILSTYILPQIFLLSSLALSQPHILIQSLMLCLAANATICPPTWSLADLTRQLGHSLDRCFWWTGLA